MLGFALLGLLGIGLIVGLGNDDDDDTQSPPEDVDQRLSTDDTSETIETANGNDVVRSQGGNDLVWLGDGDDRAFGGDGGDIIFGSAGDDLVRGEQGGDLLFAGAGEDSLFGDVGDDLLVGADIFDERTIFDVTAATNFLPIDEFNTFDVDADPMEADTLSGGVGDDYIVAGSNDVVDTGSGSDVLNVGQWVEPGAPVNVVDSDPARDVIVYSYIGPVEPGVFFGEDDDGTATLEVDGDIIAFFPNEDLFDLRAQSSILLERLG